MKTIHQAHSEHVKPVKIYLDDLKEIVGFLEGACDEVAIQSGDKLLDNIDELSSLKKESLHDLKISGRTPYVAVDMSPNQIWLYIAEDTPESRGLFEKIKTVLVRCQRPLTGLLHSSFLQGITWSLTICGILLGLKHGSPFLMSLFAVLFLLTVVWAIYGFRDWTQRFTIVVPKHRIDSPGFLKRNKDQILLAIISALIGALVAYAFK